MARTKLKAELFCSCRRKTGGCDVGHRETAVISEVTRSRDNYSHVIHVAIQWLWSSHAVYRLLCPPRWGGEGRGAGSCAEINRGLILLFVLRFQHTGLLGVMWWCISLPLSHRRCTVGWVHTYNMNSTTLTSSFPLRFVCDGGSSVVHLLLWLWYCTCVIEWNQPII